MGGGVADALAGAAEAFQNRQLGRAKAGLGQVGGEFRGGVPIAQGAKSADAAAQGGCEALERCRMKPEAQCFFELPTLGICRQAEGGRGRDADPFVGFQVAGD